MPVGGILCPINQPRDIRKAWLRTGRQILPPQPQYEVGDARQVINQIDALPC